jgi:hypothetical protein
MKIHQFRCNICDRVFGLDDNPRIEGLSDDLTEIVNPRDADIHLCRDCFAKIVRLGRSGDEH